MEVTNLQISVIDEPLIVLRHAAPHSVVAHHDVSRAASPQDGAVFAIVGDRPNAGRGLHQRLIAVVVKIGDKHIFTYRGNLRVLVQFIRDVCRVRAALEGCFAVADWVILIIVTVVGVDGGDRVRKLAARVVSIRDNVVEFKCAATLAKLDATPRRVVGVVELGDDVGRGGVTNLQKLVVRVVGPAGGESVRVGKGGFEVRVGQIGPLEFATI